MDKGQIRAELGTLKGKKGDTLFSEKTIKRLLKLPEENLSHYMDYLMSLMSSGKIDTVQTYRSKHLDFLEFISKRNYDLLSITQEVIDEYFGTYEEKGNTRLDYIKAFLVYFSLEESVDIEKFRKKTEKKPPKMTRFTAKSISEARYKYRNDIRKLYVLDMLCYAGLSMTDIGKIQEENIDFDKNAITYGGKEYTIPRKLADFICEHKEELFDYPQYMNTIIYKMREELAEYGMGNLKATDGKATKKAIFWTCPQCGNCFEAVAENWCVKQYAPDGENWVVCRENCGHE